MRVEGNSVGDHMEPALVVLGWRLSWSSKRHVRSVERNEETRAPTTEPPWAMAMQDEITRAGREAAASRTKRRVGVSASIRRWRQNEQDDDDGGDRGEGKSPGTLPASKVWRSYESRARERRNREDSKTPVLALPCHNMACGMDCG